METVKTAAEKYWIIYYLVYLGLSGAGLWRYWPRLLWYWRQPVMQDDSIYLLAAIFGTAAGIALGIAISLEVGGRMVLLIPAAVKKTQGGRPEGRSEGGPQGGSQGRPYGRTAAHQDRARQFGRAGRWGSGVAYPGGSHENSARRGGEQPFLTAA